MGAGACLDADDALTVEDPVEGDPDVHLVLTRDDVIRDDDHRSIGRQEERNDPLDERGLPGADRPTDADAKRPTTAHHDANSRPGAVS